MRPLVAVLLLLLPGPLFAQLPIQPVSVVSDSLGTQFQNLRQQNQWITDTANAVQQIQTAVKQLQDADQALQYQVQAVKSLSAGSWDGFVAAYQQETAAISLVDQTFTDFDSYDLPNIKAMVANPEYQSLTQRLQMLDHSMQASNGIVQSTNNLVKDTAANIRTNNDLVTASSQTSSLSAQLQIEAQQLGLLGQELGDTQGVLSASANFISVQQQNLQIQINEEKNAASAMMASGGGKGIFDQSDPQKHWQAMTDTSSWTEGDN